MQVARFSKESMGVSQRCLYLLKFKVNRFWCLQQCCGSEIIFTDLYPISQIISDLDPNPDPVSDPA